MTYDVYAVIYKSPSDGWAAVAVSATSGSAAIARLRGHRPVDAARAFKIESRKTEYEQDRIEGTCDLRNPSLPAPLAGAAQAEEWQISNDAIIRDWFTAAPRFRTGERLFELAAGMRV